MVFVVHGRFDNKYLTGDGPEFNYPFDKFNDARDRFYEMIEKDAGTIFLEEYNQFGEQVGCYNQGQRLIYNSKCQECGKIFRMTPYPRTGKGAAPSFVNIEKFNRGELETIWDHVTLCGDCYEQWKNKRTKIARKYPATQKQALQLKNDGVYKCSICHKYGHNCKTCPNKDG